MTRYNFCRNLLCPTSGYFQTSANFYKNTATTSRLMAVVFRFHACKKKLATSALQVQRREAAGPSRKSVNFYHIARYHAPASSRLQHLCPNSPRSHSAHIFFFFFNFSKHTTSKGYKITRDCSQKCLTIRYNKVPTPPKVFRALRQVIFLMSWN